MVQDANLSVEINHDHRALHRCENLTGGVLRRQLDEVISPDRIRRHADESEDREEADRADSDADDGQKINQREATDSKGDHDRARVRSGDAFEFPRRTPDQQQACSEDHSEHRDPAEVVDGAAWVKAPRVPPQSGHEKGGANTDDGDDQTERPAKGNRSSECATMSGVRGSEVKRSRRNQRGEE